MSYPKISLIPSPGNSTLKAGILPRSIEEKRNLVKNAIMLHMHKGTPFAIKQVFEALNLQASLQEWFE